MEVDFDVLCAIVAIPLCIVLLVVLSLGDMGAALKSRRCGACIRP